MKTGGARASGRAFRSLSSLGWAAVAATASLTCVAVWAVFQFGWLPGVP